MDELFNFKTKRIYDAFNLFSAGMNNIIIYFWVNNKLSDSCINKHSSMIRSSSGFTFIYYLLFIFITFFPRFKIDKSNFFLCPLFNEDTSKEKDITYYLQISGLVINILNQLVMLNFYFIVIKNLILRNSTANYLKGKK